jgi:hypothetical protein
MVSRPAATHWSNRSATKPIDSISIKNDRPIKPVINLPRCFHASLMRAPLSSFAQQSTSQEAVMNMQFLRRALTARLPKQASAKSSLVRRLVQAQNDPAKHRIRAWLADLDNEQLLRLDNEQLLRLGLTSEHHDLPAK